MYPRLSAGTSKTKRRLEHRGVANGPGPWVKDGFYVDGVGHSFSYASISLPAAGAFGFLTLIQSGDRPERYGRSRRLATMPATSLVQRSCALFRSMALRVARLLCLFRASASQTLKVASSKDVQRYNKRYNCKSHAPCCGHFVSCMRVSATAPSAIRRGSPRHAVITYRFFLFFILAPCAGVTGASTPTDRSKHSSTST